MLGYLWSNTNFLGYSGFILTQCMFFSFQNQINIKKLILFNLRVELKQPDKQLGLFLTIIFPYVKKSKCVKSKTFIHKKKVNS